MLILTIESNLFSLTQVNNKHSYFLYNLGNKRLQIKVGIVSRSATITDGSQPGSSLVRAETPKEGQPCLAVGDQHDGGIYSSSGTNIFPRLFLKVRLFFPMFKIF